uniref:Annexin n=1 Tax=Cacopsylla melanoneura TaxID=428564 RepID=A0A8D8UUL6_9HEMI
MSQGSPSVVPAKHFDARKDAEILRTAMKGFGTDEKAIMNVLTARSIAQRQQIEIEFKTLYGKDLIKELKSELSGNFEELILALMVPTPLFLARELHDAMAGLGTTESTLIEILCSASNAEIHAIRHAYEKEYKRSLDKDIEGDTSGHFKKLLISIAQGRREENHMVDKRCAMEEAQKLYEAGELKWGTDESTFNAILVSRSYAHLAEVFNQYTRLTGHDLNKAIDAEFSGDIQQGLKTIIKVVHSKTEYFAEQLMKSMKGLGTNDRQLIRIIVWRSEIDLLDIKKTFHILYDATLESWIEDDTSGDYKMCLLGLL